MKSIGGYFALELNRGKAVHPSAIALNTGRNALELLLRQHKYQAILFPSYSCNALLRPCFKTNTPYIFYSIDDSLSPILKKVEPNMLLLVINYFGLKNNVIKMMQQTYDSLVVDNTQSFFTPPKLKTNTFYSCRKFFGVPDGAFLYAKTPIKIDLPLDTSDTRMEHLIESIEYDTAESYHLFVEAENELSKQPIKAMSKLTEALLKNIDYPFCIKQRNSNFAFLHKV
jgi:hypothetical protein